MRWLYGAKPCTSLAHWAGAQHVSWVLWLLVTFGGAEGNSEIILGAMMPLNGLRELWPWRGDCTKQSCASGSTWGENHWWDFRRENKFCCFLHSARWGWTGVARDGAVPLPLIPSPPLPWRRCRQVLAGGFGEAENERRWEETLLHGAG